mmetsp:Transcript_13702/g.6788  ORF Transcript_13702/g.6788 Transcript_13702/m.6788 type:complete len:313 (-) Transcript_13702:204-1142(-)
MGYIHTTAMLHEAVYYLNCCSGKTYVDCTIGGAGHAKVICEKIMPRGMLIGIDQDTDAIENARKILLPFKSNVKLFHDNFENLSSILAQLNLKGVDGILVDLGVSLHQIECSGRGFSFNKDEPLDMRMNPCFEIKAEKIVNNFKENELAAIFKKFGEEHYARLIAKEIVKERKKAPIISSAYLSDIVKKVVIRSQRKRQKIHPATRVFQALRIAVNHEIEVLERFLTQAADLLNPKGRMCIIAFHSLEDRIVKRKIKAMQKGCICPPELYKCICSGKKKVRSLTKKVIKPTAQEVARNHMARSARLRVVEKI